MEPGTLVLEDGTVVPPDPAERTLRDLYAIANGTGLRLSMIQAQDRMAVGLDGTSRSLNGPEDLRILRVNRSLADVVIVGAQTARVERYGTIRLPPELVAARVHDGLAPVPDLAIITRSGVVPEGLDPDHTQIFSTEGDLDAGAVVAHLRDAGYASLLCEGGPQLASALLTEGLVGDYCLTTSPKHSGAGPAVPTVPDGMRLAHTLTGGGFTIQRWSGPS